MCFFLSLAFACFFFNGCLGFLSAILIRLFSVIRHLNYSMAMYLFSSTAKVIKSGSNFTYSAWYYQEVSSQYSAAIFQIIDILLLFIKNPENNGYGGIGTTTQWKIYNISENLNQYGKWTCNSF